MLKTSYMLRRKPELTREEFQRYWLEHHGPLVRETVGDRVRRYVQVHTELDVQAREGRPEPFDGVAELWIDETAAADPPPPQQGPDVLQQDEAHFIDFSRSPLWQGREHVIIDRGGAGRRFTYALRRRPEMTREQFQRYWLEDHGPLVRETVGARVTRYVQSHALLDAEDNPGRLARGAPEPYDGVAELWFDDSVPTDAEQERERGRILAEDEAQFIDRPNSPNWMAREHVIIER
jgi:uncharacterized protein (TIGR02118 family)